MTGPTKERFTNYACNPGRDNLRLVPRMYHVAITPIYPHYAARQRRFAAEKWGMPEDAPPKLRAAYFPPDFGNPTTRSPGQMLFLVNHPRGISSA